MYLHTLPVGDSHISKAIMNYPGPDTPPYACEGLDSAPLDSPYWEILTTLASFEIALRLLAEPDYSAANNPQKHVALMKSMEHSLDRLGTLAAEAAASYHLKQA